MIFLGYIYKEEKNQKECVNIADNFFMVGRAILYWQRCRNFAIINTLCNSIYCRSSVFICGDWKYRIMILMKIEEDILRWKERSSLKTVSIKRFTASAPEWPMLTAEKFWNAEELKAENSFRLNWRLKTLSDKNRVKKRRDFTRVYQRGKSVAGKDLVLCWRKTGLPVYRVGFTVSKKVGNAVVRNKVRRRLKEISRLRTELFLPGRDYIIIARPSASRISYREMEKELDRLAGKIKPSWKKCWFGLSVFIKRESHRCFRPVAALSRPVLNTPLKRLRNMAF